ncbi:MAG: aldo/keto reductase [Aeromicrobium sp.]|uniref:aldo/keto reductase n=1 Tax=Aeromicrobium sp. TaxID=1871063 RepID=UPI0039E5AD29
MQLRRVGRSGLRVSRLALGTMTWGSQVDEETAADLFDTFREAGGTLIDTAPVYGEGRAEALLGTLLADRGAREEVLLAGKCGVALHAGESRIDASRGAMLGQLDKSLRELHTDHLDLWQVHRWDETVPLEETLSALDHAVTSGRVRYVGVSNYSPWQTALAQAQVPHLVSTQVEYSLLCRTPEAHLVEALDYLGLGLLAWSPLGRGVLTGKYRTGTPADSRGADEGWARWLADYLQPSRAGIVEAVVRAADGLGHSPAQVALAWVRDRHGLSSAIIGPRTPVQLAELLLTEQIDIPPEITMALDDVSHDLP